MTEVLATDTIVITGRKGVLIDNDAVSLIQNWLSDTVLLSHTVLRDNPLQLIVLRKFQKILLISPATDLSRSIMHVAENDDELLSSNFQFTYSLTNTAATCEKDYLKLPERDHLFLISPPTSPPPEFDYTRCEERPSTIENVTTHLPRSHMSGEADDDKGVLLVSDVGSITIDRCQTQKSDDEMVPVMALEQRRTAAPPRSLFDSDDE
ncbi:Rcn1p KNAG_0F03300 [Huiozyma naganishii CBS 8797]|uniref:Calcipressin n=1 Tax=Huiozyma naganishii (strain ATCC MYA-139 / BCRC 22969 / CBS 8797 / KCTC 17520 / NBRC 10181 / NCYC 3082 / Yp74L-3) TaxID=1071383 RepID=J7S0H7_HUIN7|nr:hypothetical protein KNAG_0F03300 [Kazachstania naganishii CBS 8797]CCK70992.1 hypothetical protein KNAG_0F03300 [Kazachstania naganishii CBS 8797]